SVSERMPGGRVDGQVRPLRLEGGCGGGHANGGRPSQESCWILRNISQSLPRRENCGRDRRTRRRRREFPEDLRSAAAFSRPRGNLCKYGELSAGLPGSRSAGPRGKSEI